ncbi:MAG: class I SAM-dependent methyltransferase [Candidatus Latescibacteria bacterium]|nr:class I SAM-dependent methyltransferase [Candidatus Latescibacterota bacterium]
MNAVQRQPYEGLAAIYDYVMRHVDYPDWAAHVCALFARFGHHPRHSIDLACGTGSTLFELHRLGQQVSGADASAAMLEVARQRLAQTGVEIPLFHRDLRQLAGLGPFDTALCLYDSFNYLLTPEDLDRALSEISSILLPGNFFIFDICTEKNSLRHFRDVRDEERGPGFSYRRHSFYDREGRRQFNRFHIRFDNRETELAECHVQRIYPVDEIIARIEASPFELQGSFDGFTFARGSEASERIHFVLQRPADAGATLRAGPHAPQEIPHRPT